MNAHLSENKRQIALRAAWVAKRASSRLAAKALILPSSGYGLIYKMMKMTLRSGIALQGLGCTHAGSILQHAVWILL